MTESQTVLGPYLRAVFAEKKITRLEKLAAEDGSPR
jgi:hypothetical protein